MDSQETRYETKAQVIDRVKELAHGEEVPQKEEVEMLKSVFYKLHIQEREAQLKAYIDGGGDPEKYQIQPDDSEVVFKEEMALIREKRQVEFQKLEAEKQSNLKLKQDIIEKIKAMVTSPEEANKSYQDFKDLQAKWKEIGQVPAENVTELWRSYQLYVEQFYDLLKLNSEAREYDFKKNLEAKTALCEAAEKLADEKDVISAFHSLQDLHQQYREIGPVAKDLREEVWNRFKAASTVINKRHQQHFEDLRAKEEDNLSLKTTLCEKAEAVSETEPKTSAEWDEQTKAIMDLQAEWKTIGFAPQKMNVKIFERFRAACDAFFQKKTLYFKNLRERFNDNVAKKQALIDEAKSLCDSTEWKKTGDRLMQLQKDWKEIGMVPKKVSDQLWNEFIGACNKFFEARNAAHADSRNEERQNLQQKRDVVEQIKALAESAEEDLIDKLHELQDAFMAIGHVPFRDKDNVYQEYRAAVDALRDRLHEEGQQRRMNNFRQKLAGARSRGEQIVDNERTKLQRRLESLQQDLKTYENNIGFLSVASKKGNSLLDEMNRRVEKLKEEVKLVKQQIREANETNEEE